MGKRIYINNDWKFIEQFTADMPDVGFDDSHMKEIRIPHTCKETPFHYFDENIYQMVSGYRKKMIIPMEWKDHRVLLTFEGVAHECEVFVNGTGVGEHHCGYTAFTIDISDYLVYGEENILTVKVNSKEDINIPPFGYVVDYMTYGGIYRDVYLSINNLTYLEDVFLHSQISGQQIKIGSKILIQKPDSDLTITQFIRKKGTEEYELLGSVSTHSDDIEIVTEFEVKGIELWDVEHPVLYDIKTCLRKKDGSLLDEQVTTFGFRDAKFQQDGFYLNGKKLKLRGLNRHQSYPYVGYAMPKSMQVMDADILKNELGLNAVRTSHYPQSHYFIERCDEIGLLVFTELPGWQHIGDEEWKTRAVESVKEMVTQYRNHPSIILWGVRINESKDDDAFYEKTNEAARKLDPYRQTAGVRAHKKSSFLEDVYTYNDFSHDGNAPGCEPKDNVTSDSKRAYVVSEYNGHMYPTKAFDWEEHRVEHAMRHANVLDAIAAKEDIAGSFGWCMTDYNTHKDFGSGDRICYHGVMDMFRNPKLAADIYSCQQDTTQVLSLSSTMDIGEHPGCNRGKTWIYTNADSVRMYKNDRFIKEYKKEDSCYKNLLHGPILIDDFIGDAIEKGEDFKPKQAGQIKEALNYVAMNGLSHLPKKIIFTALKMMLVYHMKPTEAVTLYNKYIGDWGGTSTVYRFESIKDGEIQNICVKAPMTRMHLRVKADHTKLIEENTYDVAAVRICMQDEYNNQLYFYNEPVTLQTEGPIELIGGNIISLKGGMGGTYVRTTGQEGKATLFIHSGQTEPVKIEFEVKCGGEYE